MATLTKTEGLQVLRRIQPEAAFGLLTCDANLRVSSLFPSREMGATVLGAITLGLYLGTNRPYKFPAIVTLIVTTGFFLCTTIKVLFDRIILRKRARIWRPIFENITMGHYKEALQAIGAIWGHVSKKRVIHDDSDFQGFQFYFEHYRLSDQRIPVGLFYAVLEALNHVMHPPKVAMHHQMEEMRESIAAKISCTSRGHPWTNKIDVLLETPSTELPTNLLEPIHNRYSLLLYDLVKELRQTPESALIGDHRASCFESDKLTFRYLNLLATIGNRNVLPQDLTLIQRLLKCSSLRGLWEEVQKLTSQQIDELEQRAFGYKMGSVT